MIGVGARTGLAARSLGLDAAAGGPALQPGAQGGVFWIDLERSTSTEQIDGLGTSAGIKKTLELLGETSLLGCQGWSAGRLGICHVVSSGFFQ